MARERRIIAFCEKQPVINVVRCGDRGNIKVAEWTHLRALLLVETFTDRRALLQTFGQIGVIILRVKTSLVICGGILFAGKEHFVFTYVTMKHFESQRV